MPNYQPINYTAYQIDPNQAFMQGLQVPMAIKQINDAEVQQKAALQAQEAAKQREAVKQQALQAFVKKDPMQRTSTDYMDLVAVFPELKDQMQQGWAALSKEQQQNNLSFGAQTLNALKTVDAQGKPQIAIDMFNQRADAYENAGQKDQANQYRMLAKVAEQNPQLATDMVATTIAGLDGGDTVLKSIFDTQKQPYELQKSMAEADKASTEAAYLPPEKEAGIKKTYAEIADLRVKQFLADQQMQQGWAGIQIDQEKLKQDIIANIKTQEDNNAKLPDVTAKARDEAVDNATRIGTTINLAEDIINMYRTTGQSGGTLEGINNAIGGVFGNETSIQRSMVEDKFKQLRATLTLDNLQRLKGQSSDQEMKEMKGGFPPDNASAYQKVKFMEAVVSSGRRYQITEGNKALWMSGNGAGGLGTARKGLNINGQLIPAGTTFQQWNQQQLKINDRTLSPQAKAVLGL